LVLLADWTAAGSSRSTWRRAHGTILMPVLPGISRMIGAPNTPEQRILAGVLATGRGAVASHRSAAYLWGAAVAGDNPVDVIAPRSSGRKPSGVAVHHPRDLDDLRPVVRRAIPTTNPMRTLLDLGAVDPEAVKPALEALLIAGTLSVAGVARTLAQHRRSGRNGVLSLADALGALPLGRKAPDSVLEAMGAELFNRYGIDGWSFHPHVHGFELDFGFPHHQVDVEFDGWAYHSDREQFEHDRQRDNELAARGWTVLRFTWRKVTRQPGAVARTIRTVLDLRRAA
jgi:REase_MTES_1575